MNFNILVLLIQVARGWNGSPWANPKAAVIFMDNVLKRILSRCIIWIWARFEISLLYFHFHKYCYSTLAVLNIVGCSQGAAMSIHDP